MVENLLTNVILIFVVITILFSLYKEERERDLFCCIFRLLSLFIPMESWILAEKFIQKFSCLNHMALTINTKNLFNS